MKDKPNVIYILADDMGYGDFSAFNPDGPDTPALDRLIREGVTLENCYASSPVCAPARASILTGRYPQRCGVIDTLEARGLDRLKPSETTMADVLKQEGYHTALIGKWHLGAIDPEYHPNRRGFDEFFGFRGGWNDYYDYHVERNGRPEPSTGEYITDLFSDEAVRYVRTHAEQPFFLHLAYNAPHFPLQAPEETIQKYQASGKFNRAVATLFAMIEIMDRGIGRLLDALDELGIADDTIVVFTSDNGPDMGGEGEKSLKRFNCNLRAEKMFVYEGGIRVPAVVRCPGRFAAASRSDALVHGTDWFPTILKLCGIEPDAKLRIDGMDVTNALSGGERPVRELYWQWCRYAPDVRVNAAARRGNLKLVHAPVWEYLDLPAWEVEMDVEIKYHPERYGKAVDLPAPDQPELDAPAIELFDLETDPEESRNLVAARSDEAKEMGAKLIDWFDEVERERLG